MTLQSTWVVSTRWSTSWQSMLVCRNIISFKISESMITVCKDPWCYFTVSSILVLKLRSNRGNLKQVPFRPVLNGTTVPLRLPLNPVSADQVARFEKNGEENPLKKFVTVVLFRRKAIGSSHICFDSSTATLSIFLLTPSGLLYTNRLGTGRCVARGGFGVHSTILFDIRHANPSRREEHWIFLNRIDFIRYMIVFNHNLFFEIYQDTF